MMMTYILTLGISIHVCQVHSYTEFSPVRSYLHEHDRYIRNKWILSCFPLHNRFAAAQLEQHWQRFPFHKQPLYEIKEYFGEKVALYFCFLEHYMTFLCIPAVVGLPLQIAVFVLDDYSGQPSLFTCGGRYEPPRFVYMSLLCNLVLCCN